MNAAAWISLSSLFTTYALMIICKRIRRVRALFFHLDRESIYFYGAGAARGERMKKWLI
jgi:hypothetical protein